MNRNIASALVLAFSAVAAGNALADDITIDTTPFVSSKTRAEVQAELVQYKKAGINPWSTSYNPVAYFRAEKSRDQVRTELAAARVSGELDNLYREDSGSAYLTQVASTPVRASTTLAGTPVNAQ
ncbi:MAG TPA: DUF4148 domain-containing protein [Burkholderiaceae bacterium]|nr:DUF4148 domain-containing protein [Burkholderiaceae bacterium]